MRDKRVESMQHGEPALSRFTDSGGYEEQDPIERLRFFCSLAMNGQDWLDVEPFFAAIKQQGEPVAETAAGNYGPRLMWCSDEAKQETPIGAKLYTSAPTIPEDRVSAIMGQAQVFASAWSLVGGPFDDGTALETAKEANAELKAMLSATTKGQP